MKLSEMKKGQVAEIVGFDADDSISQRLMALGLLHSERVTLEQVAPLGDPIVVKCLGNCVSLRRHDAAVVEVKLV